MGARHWEEVDEAELKKSRRGWCLGSEEFRSKLLGFMEAKLGENHSGELPRHIPICAGFTTGEGVRFCLVLCESGLFRMSEH
jgi:hypothetical protein